MNKLIPTKDWYNYPETKPKESGYYFTHYQDKTNYPDGELGVFYYKCIYWCNNRQNWISWRSPFGSPHIFEVSCFVEKTRTDFYNPCIEKVEELYLNRTPEELTQDPTNPPVEVLEFNGICRDNCQGTKISSLPGLPE